MPGVGRPDEPLRALRAPSRLSLALLALFAMAAAKPYTWEQTDTDVTILLPMAAALKSKDVVFSLTPTVLTLGFKGQARHARSRLHAHAASSAPGRPAREAGATR